MLKEVDLVFISYGLLQWDSELLEIQDWQGVVIDEVQVIKNFGVKQSQVVRDLVCVGCSKSNCFCIVFIGIFVENWVSELWVLMDFFNFKVLGEEDFFCQCYWMLIEWYGDMLFLWDFKGCVGLFILCWLKIDKMIIFDLLEKVELSEWVGLSKEQKFLYSKIVEDIFDVIVWVLCGQCYGQVLVLFIWLKQICNYFVLVMSEGVVDDGFLGCLVKLQWFEEIFDEVIEVGDWVLLFIQFVEWGYLLQVWMQQCWKLEVFFLYGGICKSECQVMVDCFQEDF